MLEDSVRRAATILLLVSAALAGCMDRTVVVSGQLFPIDADVPDAAAEVTDEAPIEGHPPVPTGLVATLPPDAGNDEEANIPPPPPPPPVKVVEEMTSSEERPDVGPPSLGDRDPLLATGAHLAPGSSTAAEPAAEPAEGAGDRSLLLGAGLQAAMDEAVDSDATPEGLPYTAPFFARLPADTPIAIAVNPPRQIAGALGLDASLTAAGLPGELLRIASNNLTGVDLFDPNNWPLVGVDADRPIVFAVLNLDPMTLAVGWSSTDPDLQRRLIRFYAAGAGIQLHQIQRGEATLMTAADNSGPVVAWHGEDAWIVLGEGLVRGEALNRASQLARPETRLSERDQVKAIIKRLDPARQAVVLVDVPGIVTTDMTSAFDLPRIGDLQDAEDSARGRDEFESANRLMSDRFRLQMTDLVVQAGRSLAEQAVRSALYPFGMAAGSVHIEADSISTRWTFRLATGALPMQALNARAKAPPGIDALTKRAVTATIRLDLVALANWLRGLAIILNQAVIADFEARLRAETQVSFRRDVLGLFDGTMVFGLEGGETVGGVQAQPQPAVLLGIRDPQLAVQVANRLAQAYPRISRAGTGRYTMDIPGLPQIVSRFADDHIIYTFDEEVSARVADNRPPQRAEGERPQARRGMQLELDGRALADALNAPATADDPFSRLRPLRRVIGAIGRTTANLTPTRDSIELNVTIEAHAGVRSMMTDLSKAIGQSLMPGG